MKIRFAPIRSIPLEGDVLRAVAHMHFGNTVAVARSSPTKARAWARINLAKWVAGSVGMRDSTDCG